MERSPDPDKRIGFGAVPALWAEYPTHNLWLTTLWLTTVSP